MGDNKISEAVGAACSAFNATDGMLPSRMHAAIEAALPFILSVDDAQMAESYRLAHAAGEAHGKSIASLDSDVQGEAVPVAWQVEIPGKPFSIKIVRREDVAWEHAQSIHASYGEAPDIIPLYTHPQPAELSEVSGGSGELGDGVAGEWIRSAYGQPSSFTYWNMEVAFTAGWKHARDALAATGKQQVGEKEHWLDRMAAIEGRIEPSLREMEGMDEYPAGEVQGDALDTERVLSLADVHAEESREDGVRLLDRGGLLAFAQDIAAAIASRQPVGAQDIDLGQLKVEVQRLRKRTDPVLGEKAMYVRLDAVLALIDGRDAGAGVGNVQPPRDLRTKLGDAS